jgi:hypothetical protein
MLVSLDTALISGHLSNEVPGLVTGSLLLAGQKEPLIIELEGNFMRDIAGCRVDLHNPMPEADEATVQALRTWQSGAAGVMTASYRVPFVPRRKKMKHSLFREPPGLKNLLFLEWFNEQHQRILIQSWHINLTVGSPAWQLTEKEELAQTKLNRVRRKEYLLRGRRPPSPPQTPILPENGDWSQSQHLADGQTTLPLIDQTSVELSFELRRFQQLLAAPSELTSRPAVMKLLTTAGDLASHLAHVLKNFSQLKSTEWAMLITDIEQSHPLFHAALTACDKLLDHSTPGTDQRWLMGMQTSLSSITGLLEQLIKWLRAP